MDRYAVIGNPIAHCSKSPRIHAEFAQTQTPRMSYGLILPGRWKFAGCRSGVSRRQAPRHET